MTKAYIENVYQAIVELAKRDLEQAELTSVKVSIIEADGKLVIGLDMELSVVDAFPELVGTWPEEHRKVIHWTPEKPFTLKQLIKISQIWDELLQSEITRPECLWTCNQRSVVSVSSLKPKLPK